MTVYNFKLIGASPLLMHADDVTAASQINALRKSAEGKKWEKGDDRFPFWTWVTYLYHDGEHVCMPQENITAALIKAATSIKESGNTSYKSAAAAGLIPLTESFDFTVQGNAIPIAPFLQLATAPPGNDHGGREGFIALSDLAKQMGFCDFVKRASIGKAKHVRVRPKFSFWEVTGRIENVLPAEIKEKVMMEIFAVAGARVGIGDWRPGAPGKPGPYGRFTVDLEKV